MSERPDRFGRSAREHAAYNRHTYPGTEILRNKGDCRTAEELENFERQVTVTASRFRAPMKEIGYAEFKAIHAQLFADVYDWAGQERDYSSGRGVAPFCLPELIQTNMERLFRELKSENNLQGLSARQFAERAAHYANEINAVHPFIEGNGRVIREFLKDLAAQAGHELDLTRLDRETWYPAAAEGFATADPSALRRCLEAALVAESDEARRGRSDREP